MRKRFGCFGMFWTVKGIAYRNVELCVRCSLLVLSDFNVKVDAVAGDCGAVVAVVVQWRWLGRGRRGAGRHGRAWA